MNTSFSLSISAYVSSYSMLVQKALLSGKQVSEALASVKVPTGFVLQSDQVKDRVSVVARIAAEDAEGVDQLVSAARQHYTDDNIQITVFGRNVKLSEDAGAIGLKVLLFHVERLAGRARAAELVKEIISPKVELGLSAYLRERSSSIDVLRKMLASQRG